MKAKPVTWSDALSKAADMCEGSGYSLSYRAYGFGIIDGDVEFSVICTPTSYGGPDLCEIGIILGEEVPTVKGWLTPEKVVDYINRFFNHCAYCEAGILRHEALDVALHTAYLGQGQWAHDECVYSHHETEEE